MRRTNSDKKSLFKLQRDLRGARRARVLSGFFEAMEHENLHIPVSGSVEPARDPLAPPPVQAYDLDARVVGDSFDRPMVEFSCNICESVFSELLLNDAGEDVDELVDGILPHVADEHGCYRDQS